MSLPSTAERVSQNTSERINRSIQEGIVRSIEYHQAHPDRIAQRLYELDQEWDIERALETNASSLVLAGSALGFFVDRRFFALPMVVSAFLLQHALQGWCPPLPVLRRLGYRTAREIHHERTALERIMSTEH